jgi:hypothetical protein
MTVVSSRFTVARSLIGVAAAVFAAAGFAGQSGEVLVDHDRSIEQRTNMPVREGPLQPVQLQALRSGCPGRVDLAGCVSMNMQAPISAGEIVGTASSTQGTLQAVQIQALRSGCPGRVDLAACVSMNMQAPINAGEIVGTASSTQGALSTDGQEVSTLGRK